MRQSASNALLVCTAGVLLRRLEADPHLSSCDVVLVDEVHAEQLLVSLEEDAAVPCPTRPPPIWQVLLGADDVKDDLQQPKSEDDAAQAAQGALKFLPLLIGFFAPCLVQWPLGTPPDSSLHTFPPRRSGPRYHWPTPPFPPPPQPSPAHTPQWPMLGAHTPEALRQRLRPCRPCPVAGAGQRCVQHGV